MEWVAQIHRDGLFILGNLLLFVCLFKFSNRSKSEDIKTIFWGLFYGFSGTIVVWIARPYWVQVVFVSILSWLILFSLIYTFNEVSRHEQ